MTSQQHGFLNGKIEVGSVLHGYRVDRTIELPRIHGRAYLMVHLKTGARHLHIASQDRENAFGVTFKTVPSDSSGVAHILEHTVLCGSRRYPVRDPFFSMLKRSLSTFMNAFTASDWTMYPFCSQNRKDFYNLMDVYLDAAFFPRLDELSFKQEGHRLEIVPDPENNDDFKLQFKGVVYNEMKGAMSSPDQVMARSLLNALYPDTTYRHNSGGDPACIPDLTWQQLRQFHKRHYHPSNAYFYTYGNLPVEQHLEFIQGKVLKHFNRIDPGTEVLSQPRWKDPRNARYTYPLAGDQDPQRRSQVCIAWLTADIRETFEILLLAVLEQVLLGNSASPLRKALMDSGLGSSLSDHTGFDAENRDTMFTCGLKDVSESDADAIERIVFDTLEDLVKNGVDLELVEAAIHQIEFGRKEITNTPYPYGLKLLLGVIGSWLHGGDPARVLRLEDEFERLREAVAAGGFIEEKIEHYFLRNCHRVRFVLAPDPEKAAADLQQEARRLLQIKKRLTSEQIDRIKEDSRKLALLQETPEDLACLPTLELEDIPPSVVRVTPDDKGEGGPGWLYIQPTSGIFYISAAASVAQVPAGHLELVPFLAYVFTKVGTNYSDYVTLARRLDANVGGMSLSAIARRDYRPGDQCLPLVVLTAKCLERNLEPMLELVAEIVGQIVFSDLERLKQLLLEYRAGLEAMVIHNGHRLAISLASRNFSPAAWLSEIWSGIHQLQYIKRVTENLDSEKLGLLATNLADCVEKIFQPANVVLALIGAEQPVQKAAAWLKDNPVMGGFGQGASCFKASGLGLQASKEAIMEGWHTSSAVAFVAQSFPAVAMGHPDAPVLAVTAKILRSAYLHREIREKGGAYGGFALYNSETGIFSLGSYRDPQINRTLEIYNKSGEFLASGVINPQDVKEAILQVCSDIDRPDPPAIEARKAFVRDLLGLDDHMRENFKRQLLTVTLEDVLRVAAKYFHKRDGKTSVAVIAGKEQLEKANQSLAQSLMLHPI